MKTQKLMWMALLVPALFASCEKDNENKEIQYPEGSVVWKNDTTITDHFILPKGKSLYIEAGVTVTMDNIEKRPEIVILGNLYSMGTAAEPVTFTVPSQYQNKENRYSRYWGGIICGYDSEEVLLDHTIIEYGGAQTTEESASFQNQLFKTETGEGVPGFHFCNVDGRFVVKDCIFRNNAEDQIYITGGQSIVMNNVFYHSGYDGGEAINYKSGCLADIAYNLIYDANSNAFKLSNNGALEPQAHLFVYNNTVVNCGWRRPKVKGGSIWLEYNVYAELYNNLMFDCRWGCKEDAGNPRDTRSVITPNYYFASTETGVTQYGANETKGQLQGTNDVYSASAGDKNPNFSIFSIQSNVDINCGTTGSGNVPQDFNENWDFRLQSGSNAIGKGITGFTRHFGTTGIEINGEIYTSPAPGTYAGAFGTK
ncbi:MAG: right-handed parallel beta-helix repeat-containing protein [Breznakibacter sp.]